MSTQTVSWHVELSVNAGCLDAFRALSDEMVTRAASEPGTLVFERFQSEDGRRVHVYERYRDCEAAVLHLDRFAREFATEFARLVTRNSFCVYGHTDAALRGRLDRFGASYLSPMVSFCRID